MDHVAIMRKSWRLTEKILAGTKKIESRWYLNKSAPWGKIAAGDRVFFKDSGDPVTVQADVEKVLAFDGLTPAKVKELLDKYGGVDGIETVDAENFYARFKDKNYCLLIFLKNPKAIEPFEIDKSGFGLMAAWLTVDSIDRIRK
jgi:ASC-1-like (ASCH) protein